MLAFFVIGVSGVLFVISGLRVESRKSYWLIAGYEEMTHEEQAKYDIERITAFVGRFMVAVGIAAILLSFVFLLWPNHSSSAGFGFGVLLFSACIWMLKEINSEKYRRKESAVSQTYSESEQN